MSDSDNLLRSLISSFHRLQKELDEINAANSSSLSKATNSTVSSYSEDSPPKIMPANTARKSNQDINRNDCQVEEDSIIGDSFYESDAMKVMLPCLKKSVKDLQQQSRALLSQDNAEELKDVLKRPTENVTILQLMWEDRKRVGDIIKELADAKRTIYNLQSQILEEREEHKLYKNESMKKIDALKERVELMKANGKKRDQEQLVILKKLDKKLAELSDTTENCFKQEEILKANLVNAAVENKKLREELTCVRATYKHELDKMQREAAALAERQIIGENINGAAGDPQNCVIPPETNGTRKIYEEFKKKGNSTTSIVGLMTYGGNTNRKDNDSDKENKITRKNSKIPSLSTKISSTSVPHGLNRNKSYGNLDEIIRLTSVNSMPPTPPSLHDLDIETADETLLRELFFKF